MTIQLQNQCPPQAPPVNEQGRAFDPDATTDERTYALCIHLTLLGHLILTVFVIIVPIVMWLSKKEDSPFIDDHGREVINFQITLIIYSILFAIIFAIIAIPLGLLTFSVGLALAFFPYILGLVGMVQASMAANRGEFYRYPMNIRFL
jgi:uncharacterized protein